MLYLTVDLQLPLKRNLQSFFWMILSWSLGVVEMAKVKMNSDWMNVLATTALPSGEMEACCHS
jgi:hypothetical protein